MTQQNSSEPTCHNYTSEWWTTTATRRVRGRATFLHARTYAGMVFPWTTRDPDSPALRLAGALAALWLSSALGWVEAKLTFEVPRPSRDDESTARSSSDAASPPPSATSHPPRGAARKRRRAEAFASPENRNPASGGDFSPSKPVLRRSPLALAASLALSALALLSPLALPLGRLGRLFLALGAFQASLKTLEARLGRLPRAFLDRGVSPGHYFATLVEPDTAAPLERDRARTHIDRLRLAAPRLRLAAPKAFAVFALALAGGEDFSRPFGSDRGVVARFASRLDVSTSTSPPAWVFFPLDTYFDAWFLYLAFDAAMDLVAGTQTVLTGVRATRPFDAPLTRSRSLREFWSRRWNKPAQRALRRVAYDPIRAGSNPRWVATVATFALSALMHEWVCWIAFLGSGEGKLPEGFVAGAQTAYFLAQAFAVAVERAVERRWTAFRDASLAVRLPIVVAWLSVTTTLFMDVVRAGGVFDEIREIAVWTTRATKIVPGA